MSDLKDVKIGDWLVFDSSSKAAAEPVLRQVIKVTAGLVKTDNYTFWKDGRAFYGHYKSMTARVATAAEIEKWLSRNEKQKPVTQQPGTSEEQKLARYLASVDEDKWLQLGLPKLKSIVAALEKAKS